MATPRTAPITAVMSASPRMIWRICRRDAPTARSSPISRVRSYTDSASVLTMPSRAMSTDSASSA
jgi:hypothetical protein